MDAPHLLPADRLGLYLIPVGARVLRQQQGAWPARGVVWSFAFLAFSYIGIRLLGAGA